MEVENLAALRQLPSGWSLLVDQTRFHEMRIEVAHAHGITVITRRAGELSNNWSLGNNLRFRIDMAGAAVHGLRIGFDRVDDISLVRSVKALSPEAHAEHKQRWTALIALVAGLLLCSLAYNLFLLTWLRTSFQRWYVVWVASALAYSLVWSGAAYYVLPGLAGPITTRLNYVLVGLVVASATVFFFVLIEPGRLSKRLIRTGQTLAAVVFGCAVMAAADGLVSPATSDRLLNLAFIVCTTCVLVGLVSAIRQRSRTVWFYLAGWTPPILIFALRIARNFGLMEQSDAIDMATFAALGIEAVMLSVAIADRFRELRRERDAAEIEREAMRWAATTDPLTGLSNRLAFQERLAAISEANGGAELVIADLDYLKAANDTAGHDAGDTLIIEAGRRLREVAGAGAMVARIGGDEFGILLEGKHRARLQFVLQEVEQSARSTCSVAGHRISASLSAGHASWTAEVPQPEDLYKQADIALYRAKAEGRGKWRRYSDAMHDEEEKKRRIRAEARLGLSRGEFELYYQPIIDLRSGVICSHEALLRWHHPEHGTIGPNEFGPVFDELDLVAALQDRVLDLVLGRLAAAHAADEELRTASVNLVASQLQGRAGADIILKRLAAYELPGSALIAEVTETAMLGRQGGPVAECLNRLRAAGIAVALDDFGTGYASLLHLRDFPADALKIDRSFVAGLPGDKDSQKIVRSIVALAHGLGKHVVAEGIETEEQMEFLRHLGCNAGQGYLIGRPAPYISSPLAQVQAA